MAGNTCNEYAITCSAFIHLHNTKTIAVSPTHDEEGTRHAETTQRIGRPGQEANGKLTALRRIVAGEYRAPGAVADGGGPTRLRGKRGNRQDTVGDNRRATTGGVAGQAGKKEHRGDAFLLQGSV